MQQLELPLFFLEKSHQQLRVERCLFCPPQSKKFWGIEGFAVAFCSRECAHHAGKCAGFPMAAGVYEEMGPDGKLTRGIIYKGKSSGQKLPAHK
jgi:hypothetical protein